MLAALDARALAEGLVPGLTLADARARLPILAAFPHDPAADAVCLEWLADGCDRYTPMVAVVPPQALLLDISGCAHLLGGEATLKADIATRLHRLGFSVRLGEAGNGAAALALARHQLARPGDLPVSELAVSGEVHLALRRAGLRTVAAVVRQPRAALAARFGSVLLLSLDRLLEAEDAPLSPRRLVPPIAVERRFAAPLVAVEAALAAMEQLAVRASLALAERGEGGRRFEFALFRSDGHVARLAVDTAAPLRDAKVLARLLRERIGALNDPLDPGFGYDLLRLSVPVTAPLDTSQLGLEGGALAEAEIAALIDRLVARLGPGRVRRLVPADSHIPEQAAFDLPLAEAPNAAWPVLNADVTIWRPLELFDPPQAIEVTAEVPDGPPRRFKWQKRFYEVVRHEGPERIAAPWWRRADGQGLTRDYYRVEDGAGHRFWVFRHGLFGDEKVSPGWYLHGRFA